MSLRAAGGRGGRAWLWIPAGTVLLAVLAYAPWRGNPFHFDDRLTVLDNTSLQDLGGLSRGILSGRGLTFLSYGVNHAISGQDPRGFHVTDLGLHLAASGLVGWLAFILLRSAASASAAAACFALHPLNSEAVLYISSRPDLVSSFTALLAALALHRAAGEALGGRGRRAAAWAAVSALLAAFGFHAAKETGGMGWFLGLLLAGRRCWDADGGRWRGRWILLCAVSALGAFLLLGLWAGRQGMTLMQQLQGGPRHPVMDYPEHLGAQARVHAWYLMPRLLFPFRLCMSPGIPAVPAPWPGAGAAAVLLLQAGTALAVLGWWRGGAARLAALAWAWWFLGQAPTTLIALGDPAFEHRAYLAVVGPAVMAGWILARAGAAFARLGWGPAGAGLMAVLAALGALRDHRRGADYRSEALLWREVVRDAPAKPGARLNLGQAYDTEDGDGARAVRQYSLALIRATPGFQAMIVNNIGNLQIQQGRYDEAVRSHEIALRLNPGNSDIRMNRAIAMVAAGRQEEGERELRDLVAAHPRSAGMHRALANALTQRGDVDGAAAMLRRTLALSPDLAGAYVDLARNALARKDAATAVAVLEEGVRRCGHQGRVWHWLGFARYAAGDLDGAEAACRRGLALAPGAWRDHVTLAAICERRGDEEGALQAYRAAAAILPGDPMLTETLARLELRRRLRR